VGDIHPLPHSGYAGCRLDAVRSVAPTVNERSILLFLKFIDKGKYRRLEGKTWKTTTFSLRARPPSVGVADETAVPSKYKMLR